MTFIFWAILFPVLNCKTYTLSHGLILVVTGLYFDCFVFEGFLDELRGFVVAALIVPATHVEEVLVVALGFTFLGLMFLAEVTATRLFAVQSVVSHEFAHEDKVAQVNSFVEPQC